MWEEKIKKLNQGESNEYFEVYYELEKNAYAEILKAKEGNFTATVSELAARFEMDNMELTAFIDGINESLDPSLDVESLTEESEVTLNIVWEELYKNMHKAKASWLYNLPEWENILDEEERHALLVEYRKSTQVIRESFAGRNDPCPCGSGKKFKKCCGKA